MLRMDSVNAFYGDVQILFDVSMEIRENEIVTILGSNGAGKTTLIKTICNLLPIRSGSIFYKRNESTKYRHINGWIWGYHWFRKAGVCFRTCPSWTICCWVLIH